MRHELDAPLINPGNYGFMHWMLYGIPGSASKPPEGKRALPFRRGQGSRSKLSEG